MPQFIRSRHIVLYWPNDGEIDPRPIAQRAWRMGKHCYLPVVHPFAPRLMWFVRWQPNTVLTHNRFGIPEPDPVHETRWRAPYLNLVLLPLVAFDRQGGRLGMGGGFYDRTFAFKAQKGGKRRGPNLIGLAHACQETAEVVKDRWDVPLEAVVTDRERVR